MGLQRYFSAHEDTLLLQQTQTWFPAPTPRGSCLPVIPGLRYQTLLASLASALIHIYPNTDTSKHN